MELLVIDSTGSVPGLSGAPIGTGPKFVGRSQGPHRGKVACTGQVAFDF